MSSNCSCCPAGYETCDFKRDAPRVWTIADNPAVQLTDSGLFQDRECFHKQMGPIENFPCCGGTGVCWREDLSLPFESFFGEEPSPAVREAYCECAAGRKKNQLETPTETVDSIAAELKRAGKVVK